MLGRVIYICYRHLLLLTSGNYTYVLVKNSISNFVSYICFGLLSKVRNGWDIIRFSLLCSFEYFVEKRAVFLTLWFDVTDVHLLFLGKTEPARGRWSLISRVQSTRIGSWWLINGEGPSNSPLPVQFE